MHGTKADVQTQIISKSVGGEKGQSILVFFQTENEQSRLFEQQRLLARGIRQTDSQRHRKRGNRAAVSRGGHEGKSRYGSALQ